MRYGIVLPQTEIGRDPVGITTFVRQAETAGFSFLTVYDHVLGAERDSRPDWDGPYDLHDQFHEPFVLYGYLAALSSLELVTGVLVLPQRQTALVAKQAAEVDILTGGRFRLGVGVGWNAVEYEALGIDFATRGARCEEQVEVMRRLWSEDSVTFEGRFHHIDRAGILPKPIQDPIPIWMGGRAPRALERIGRASDGWICNVRPGEELDRALESVNDAASRAGRATPVALQVGLRVPNFDPGELERQLEAVERVGATHVAVNGLRPKRSVAEHLEVIDFAAATLGERLRGGD